MLKPNFLIFLMLGLFSCFGKKTPAKPDLGSELERLFPGQFQVLISNLKMLDIKAQFQGVKQAVVADKTDSEIHCFIDWEKNAAALGIDSAKVAAAHQAAKRDIEQARALFALLKEKGLKNTSVGVIKQAAYLQVFDEPTPALRKHTLEILQSVVGQIPQTHVFIELLEPQAYRQRYQDIIPASHWKTEAGLQQDELILSLEVRMEEHFDIPELTRHWKINSGCRRLREARDQAYQTALAWSSKYLPKPFYMNDDGYTTVETLISDEPALRWGYPYFEQNSSEGEQFVTDAKGYVTGVYYFDRKTFSNLRKQANE